MPPTLTSQNFSPSLTNVMFAKTKKTEEKLSTLEEAVGIMCSSNKSYN